MGKEDKKKKQISPYDAQGNFTEEWLDQAQDYQHLTPTAFDESNSIVHYVNNPTKDPNVGYFRGKKVDYPFMTTQNNQKPAPKKAAAKSSKQQATPFDQNGGPQRLSPFDPKVIQAVELSEKPKNNTRRGGPLNPGIANDPFFRTPQQRQDRIQESWAFGANERARNPVVTPEYLKGRAQEIALARGQQTPYGQYQDTETPGMQFAAIDPRFGGGFAFRQANGGGGLDARTVGRMQDYGAAKALMDAGVSKGSVTGPDGAIPGLYHEQGLLSPAMRQQANVAGTTEMLRQLMQGVGTRQQQQQQLPASQNSAQPAQTLGQSVTNGGVKQESAMPQMSNGASAVNLPGAMSALDSLGRGQAPKIGLDTPTMANIGMLLKGVSDVGHILDQGPQFSLPFGQGMQAAGAKLRNWFGDAFAEDPGFNDQVVESTNRPAPHTFGAQYQPTPWDLVRLQEMGSAPQGQQQQAQQPIQPQPQTPTQQPQQLTANEIMEYRMLMSKPFNQMTMVEQARIAELINKLNFGGQKATPYTM